MPKRSKELSFLLLLNITGYFFAGAQVNDAQLWTSLNLEKAITPSFSATFTEEFRLNENYSEVGTIFSDAGFSYKLNSSWKAAISYRFTFKRRLDDSYGKRHRCYGDISWKNKLGGFTLAYRLRMQMQYAGVYSDDKGKVPEWYSRHKFSLRYNTGRPVKPYVSSELFFDIRNPAGINFDNLRFSAGIEYKPDKRNSFDLFFIHQRETNVTNPEFDYVTGMGFSHLF